MEKNELQAASSGATKPICKCSYPSCSNSAEKVNGDRYCMLELAHTEPTEIGKLRSGDKFSFVELPYLVHTFTGNFGEYCTYRKEDWTMTENNLKRIVNKVI